MKVVFAVLIYLLPGVMPFPLIEAQLEVTCEEYGGPQATLEARPVNGNIEGRRDIPAIFVICLKPASPGEEPEAEPTPSPARPGSQHAAPRRDT